MKVNVDFEGDIFTGEQLPEYFDVENFNELLQLFYIGYKIPFKKMLAHNVSVDIIRHDKVETFSIKDHNKSFQRGDRILFRESEGLAKASTALLLAGLLFATAGIFSLPGGFGAVGGVAHNALVGSADLGVSGQGLTALTKGLSNFGKGIGSLFAAAEHPVVTNGLFIAATAAFSRAFQPPDAREINNKSSNFYTPDGNLEEQDQPIPLALGTNVPCGTVLAGYSIRIKDVSEDDL